ncbi:MAG: glycosyltransferase family 4 protein [Ignavibacteria bacterium]|nr:glycosyltransferase family 4 protein [Ignavibacteria bacterium]
MKILKCCGSYSLGGIEIYIIRTIEVLLKHGHEVHFACPYGSSLHKKALGLGISVFPLMEHGIRRLKAVFRLKEIIRENNYSIIHTHLSNDLWTIVPAISFSGVNSRLILSKCMASGISKKDLFHRYLYKHVDKIIAVSSFIRENVIETCPADPSKITVINDAVSVSDFDPSMYNRNDIRKSLGFSEIDVVVGMIGRMTPGKGHDIFFNAVKLLSTKYDMVKFIVVGSASYGESEYEKKLHIMAKEMGVKEKIIFTGFSENVAYYLSAMDILAFPSKEESFGGTLLEAMAMKVTPVAFSSGGVTDIIIDGKTGLLAEKANSDDFIHKLCQLIEDNKLRKEMSEKCRERVLENFELDSNIKLVEKLYEEVSKET